MGGAELLHPFAHIASLVRSSTWVFPPLFRLLLIGEDLFGEFGLDLLTLPSLSALVPATYGFKVALLQMYMLFRMILYAMSVLTELILSTWWPIVGYMTAVS